MTKVLRRNSKDIQLLKRILKNNNHSIVIGPFWVEFIGLFGVEYKIPITVYNDVIDNR